MRTVIILEPHQPLGLLINTASILSITIRDVVENIRGEDTLDASGIKHLGVIKTPLPILSADSDTLRSIYEKVKNNDKFLVADFTKLAQSCKTYDEYTEKCLNTKNCDMKILGLAIYGKRKDINKIVGNLKTLK